MMNEEMVDEIIKAEEPKPFVTCTRWAQTGNQMMMIAATIATALRNGADYLIPPFTSNNSLWPPVMTHLPQYDGEKHQISTRYYEPEDYTYKPIPYTPNMCISGYWQCEKHFTDCKDEIRKAFGFPEVFDISGTVAVHVRRGDFVDNPEKFPPLPLEYYMEAMSEFAIDYKFMIFSDDPDWVKETFLKTPFADRCIFMHKCDPVEDMKKMSRCEHFIIANSTFSWMAAWLSVSPTKVVYAPCKEKWFGPEIGKPTADNIIPEDWIQIKF
jgi:hypothetical protein